METVASNAGVVAIYLLFWLFFSSQLVFLPFKEVVAVGVTDRLVFNRKKIKTEQNKNKRKQNAQINI